MFEGCSLKLGSLLRYGKLEVAMAIHGLSETSFSIINEVECTKAAPNRQAMGMYYKRMKRVKNLNHKSSHMNFFNG